MSLAECRQLTLAQLNAEFGIDPEEDASGAMEVIVTARRKVFAEHCEAERITPKQLADLDIETVAKSVKNCANVPRPVLKAYVRDFVASAK